MERSPWLRMEAVVVMEAAVAVVELSVGPALVRHHRRRNKWTLHQQVKLRKSATLKTVVDDEALYSSTILFSPTARQQGRCQRCCKRQRNGRGWIKFGQRWPPRLRWHCV
jgi:hypothetical protein